MDFLPAWFLLDLLALIITVIVTILGIIIAIATSRKNPKYKTAKYCSHCDSTELTPIVVDKYVPTASNDFFKSNIWTTLIFIIITHIVFIGIIFGEKEGFDILEYLFNVIEKTSILELAIDIETIIMVITITKYQIALFFINLILYFIIGFKKESTILSICNECKTVTDVNSYK